MQPAQAPLPDADQSVPFIAHAHFQRELPLGHLAVVMDPDKARGYVMHLTLANQLAIAFIGVGAALALSGKVWVGGGLVAFGVIGRRLVRSQAGKIALHLALRNAKVYEQLTQGGIMEVRRKA